MRIGVIIKRARESERRRFISEVTPMAEESWLCSRARSIINRDIDYFARLKMHSGGCGQLTRPPEQKPPVSDRDQFKTDFLKARLF